MKERTPRPRPRPRSLRSGAFFVFPLGLLFLLLAPMAPMAPASGGAFHLSAQEPDTVRAGRERDPRDRPEQEEQVGDTIAADTLAPPPPSLPALEPLGPASWARGVWEWDREALLRLPDLSLLQLLERIPGLVPVQVDIANQPEAPALFGAAAGAVRYVLDGFELDPLVAPTFDPSRIGLLALERVRVERRVTGATVHLETLSPEQPTSRSIIEAGTGDYDIQLFRGMFLAPHVLGGPLAVGFERLATGGAIRGSSNQNVGWLKWSWVRDSAGIQLELRQSGTERSGVGAALNGVRRDWVVRARNIFGPVTGEVYAGASSVEDDRGAVGEEGEALQLREGVPHGGIRLRSSLEDAPLPVEVRAALRLRDHPRLPVGELELGVRSLPLPFLALEAEAVQGRWRAGFTTGRWAARAQAGPVLGVTLFSEVSRGAPALGDGLELRVVSPRSQDIRVSRDGLRLGAEARVGGLALAGAALRTRADRIPGFGLELEPSFPRLAGAEATGVEVLARLPTLWDPLTLQGWYVGLDAPSDWPYLPRHHWRAALVYHHSPLPSGNLEIFARLEHVFRGRMTVPAPVDTTITPTPEFARTEVGAQRATNLELTLRVLTVRAFFRWENLMNRLDQRDIPGFTHPGQHVLYGVKWEFIN